VTEVKSQAAKGSRLAEPSSRADENGTERVATQDVHDVVRRRILDGTIEPGTELSQLELSKRLSVSRTPLREALKLLEREGLVVNNGPHRLVQISPLSMVDLDDLYSLRVLGESLAIGLTVPTLREADFERLEQEIDVAANDPTREVREKAHRRFHAGLRVGTAQRLREHLEVLFEHAERYQRAFLREDVGVAEAKYKEHLAILEACRARDRQLARELLVEHIASTAMHLMTSESHAPFALPAAIRMATASGRP
jgi:DNA-binding GntR family transcriptional regulator